jgi:hypothetical protein
MVEHVSIGPLIAQRSTCVLVGGRPRCWGDVPSINDGVPMSSVAFSAIRVGGSQACALSLAGQADFADDRDLPASNWKDLSINMSSTVCGVTESGELRCFAWSAYRSLLTSNPQLASMQPFAFQPLAAIDAFLSRVPAGNDFVRVAMDGESTAACAMRLSGELSCWGDDDVDPEIARTVLRDFAVDPVVCGIDSSGLPRCFGSTGTNVTGEPGMTYSAISAGRVSTCFQRSIDQTWLCYGVTFDPNLRRCPTSATPRALRELAIGIFHACGIDLEGRLTCWDINGASASRADLPPDL